MDDEVTVKELISKISDDLLESQAERLEAGRRAVFEVSELTIELAFVVSRSKQGRAGVDLRVLSVGGEATRGDEQTQRMTLKLVAVGGGAPEDDDGELTRLDYDDDLPVRPRLRRPGDT